MSAETLRRAAALIRERAEAATADVCPEWTRNAVRHIARNCEIECAAQHKYGDAPVTVPHDHYGDSEATWSRYDDAEHIASWHPAVALAVADWLGAEAVRYDEILKDTQRPSRGVDEPPAIAYRKPDLAHSIAAGHCRLSLAVARTYLGEQP